MTKAGNVGTLEELDAERQLVIFNQTFGQDPGYTAYLKAEYEKDCRRLDLDPDTWEGSRWAA